jgi:integrase
LTPTAVKALKAWRKVYPGDGVLVCPSEVEGTYLGTKAIARTMGAGFRAAKIAERTPYEAGRVTFGTLVGGSGNVSAFTLQKWMGHADVKTTERYVKAQPGLSAGELAALGG